MRNPTFPLTRLAVAITVCLAFLATHARELAAQAPPSKAATIARPTPDAPEQESLQDKKARLRKMVDDKRAELAAAAQEDATNAQKTPPPAGVPDAPDAPGAPEPPAADAAPQVVGNSPNMILMLKPYLQDANVDQRFFTEVSLYCGKEQTFDQLRVCLSYPRLHVRPVQIFDYPLAELLDPKRPALTTTEPGFVTYSVELAKPLKVLDRRPLLKIVWEAIGKTPGARLQLDSPGLPKERQSALFLGEENLLESKTTEGRACIGAMIVIGQEAAAEDRSSYKVWKKGPKDNQNENPIEPTLKLSMRSTSKDPKPNEEFVIDILLDNPHYEAFDELRLALAFDPEKIRVLDWDYKGWITRGVNIFDGHAHETFPFNIHTRNTVENRRGRIDYYMANSMLASRPAGCVARVHCRALAPGALRTLTLFPPDQTDNWFTDIRAQGVSVLKKPPQALTQTARRTSTRVTRLPF